MTWATCHAGPHGDQSRVASAGVGNFDDPYTFWIARAIWPSQSQLSHGMLCVGSRRHCRSGAPAGVWSNASTTHWPTPVTTGANDCVRLIVTVTAAYVPVRR